MVMANKDWEGKLADVKPMRLKYARIGAARTRCRGVTLARARASHRRGMVIRVLEWAGPDESSPNQFWCGVTLDGESSGYFPARCARRRFGTQGP